MNLPLKRLVLGLAMVLAAASGTTSAESSALFVNTTSGTIDCTDRDVNITASNAELTLTGRCKGVYFVGSSTRATIESATLLQVSVDDVQIEVKGPVEEAFVIGSRAVLVLDKVGQLNVNGDSARIEAASIAALSVVGSRNSVRWTAGSPTINDIGSGNTLQPKR